MASAFSFIAGSTLTVATNYFTFASIPQSYSNLMLLVGGSNTSGDYGGFYLRFNGTDYASTMTGRRNRWTGSTTATDTSKESPWPIVSYGEPSAKSFAEYYIPNYSTSGAPKSASVIGGSPNQTFVMYNNLWWNQTDAITTVEVGIFDAASNKFAIGSSAYLYGISNA